MAAFSSLIKFVKSVITKSPRKFIEKSATHAFHVSILQGFNVSYRKMYFLETYIQILIILIKFCSPTKMFQNWYNFDKPRNMKQNFIFLH